MKILNTLLLLSLVLFALIPPAIAQENEDPESSPLTEDSRAFQFRITNNFNLSSFNGSAFSYKWHKSESSARRVGISFHNRYRQADESVVYDNESTETENESEQTSMDFNISVNYDWIYYPDTDSEIQFFYGFGPSAGTQFRKNKNENDNRTTIIKSIEGTIGAAGFSGVEWFFHRSMSLHAEYRANISFTYQKSESETEPTEDSSTVESKQTSNNTFIELRSHGVRFGISVYF